MKKSREIGRTPDFDAHRFSMCTAVAFTLPVSYPSISQRCAYSGLLFTHALYACCLWLSPNCLLEYSVVMEFGASDTAKPAVV